MSLWEATSVSQKAFPIFLYPKFTLIKFLKILGSKRLPPKSHSLSKSVSEKTGPRLRSASTGRDKRSEFQARYWAFLFSNLQRAIDEIHKTVEYSESLPSCQEAILVLENYIREFKALAEFFQMSWDYERTPLPQRPSSIAWEVRKTSAVPRRSNKNFSSPSMSGKSSPSSFSGSNSPCPTIEESKQMGRNHLKSPEQRSRGSRKCEKKVVRSDYSEALLQAAKERKFEQLLKDSQPLADPQPLQKLKSISLENLNQVTDSQADQFQPFFAIHMRDDETQTEGIEDDNLTLLEYITKYCSQQAVASPSKSTPIAETENSKETSTPSSEPQALPSLSDVLKPSSKSDEQQKSIESCTSSKLVVKPPVRANYSLRNQTITSKNSKVSVESTTRKSSTTATARTSRSTTSANLKSVSQAASSAPKPTKSVPVRSKTMIEIPKQQQRFSIRSGELRKKKSLEDNTTDSSTSTLKASTERLGSRSSVRGSGEIKKLSTKPKPTGNGAGDGWMTVKSNKRRSSWSNQRFDQPSASASLPTLLALLNENVEETQKEPLSSEMTVKALKPTNENVKNIPAKPASAKPVEQKREHPKIKPAASKTKPLMSALAQSKKITSAVKAKVQCNAPSKRVTVNEKPKAQPVVKQNQQNIKRQKSDLTGLNLKTLRKEYLRREKYAPSRKEKESEDERKVDMNDVRLQTSKVLISETIDNLYCELGGQNAKFTNGALSSCDEFEDDVESDDDHQKKLIEEQLSLERQIMELESQEIDVDTETDETDCEAILCDLEDNESSENNDPEGRKSIASFIDDDMTLEMRYAPMLTDLTQLERAETLATLQELVARDPGRAQKLHLKLSSPSRRRSFHETLKKYQGKQSRAQEKRQALALLKAQKIQQLIQVSVVFGTLEPSICNFSSQQRVEIVKAAKSQLTESRRQKMQQKLQRATENRENYLKSKIKKAHDEEEKLKEIAFIKNIELQNKRLDLLESNKEQEGRLQDLEIERYALSTQHKTS